MENFKEDSLFYKNIHNMEFMNFQHGIFRTYTTISKKYYFIKFILWIFKVF